MEKSLVTFAAQMAFAAHMGQKRKYNGLPYIEHPMRVAGRITMIEDVPDHVIAAAWLHDVKEDCRDFWDTHCSELPQEVIELVEWLTHTSKTGEHAHLNRAARKALDREQLSKAPVWAKIIKIYDRVDNLMELSRDDVGFVKLYCEESTALLNALETNADLHIQALCVLARSYVKKVLEDLLPKQGVENDDSRSS